MSSDVITTALVPAASYDLTDLATVKDELSIDTSDPSADIFLGRAITQVSLAIANYCNRVFPVETVQDVCYPARDAYPYQLPGGSFPLQLSRWPVIPAAATLTTSAPTSSGTVLPFASTTGVAAGMPISGDGIASGSVVASLVADTSVTLSRAIATPITAGAAINFGMAVSVAEQPGAQAKLDAGSDYALDAARGCLTRLNRATGLPRRWEAMPTNVIYQAGYATIPDDLEDVALRVITARYNARGRDPLLKSQDQPGLGHQTYWIGTIPGVQGAFTQEVAGILDKYRVPVAL